MPGSRGNDTLDGRGKGDFKKYEEQCQCIRQHFETFDQKSKHNYILMLNRLNVGANIVGGICKIYY